MSKPHTTKEILCGIQAKTRKARQEGFEPPTRGLEGRCSVLLSYWRVRMGGLNVAMVNFRPITYVGQTIHSLRPIQRGLVTTGKAAPCAIFD